MCKKIHPHSRQMKEGFIYLIIVYNRRKTPPPRKTQGRGLQYRHCQPYHHHQHSPPLPAVVVVSLSLLAPHQPMVVVPPHHCSPFPPCEQSLMVVVGGGLLSCSISGTYNKSRTKLVERKSIINE